MKHTIRFLLFCIFIIIALLPFSMALVPTDGMVILQDTTFSQGTYNLPNGIFIGNDNITLDCNNAILIGSGTGNGISAQYTQGVTIKNCIVMNYQSGVYLYSSSNNNLLDNTANNNTDSGIYVGTGHHGTVPYNNTLSGNTVNNNGWYGIYLYSSTDNNLTGNTVNNNLVYGIFLSANNIIDDGRRNLSASSNNVLTGNIVTGSGEGIHLSSSNNVLTGNIVTNNLGGRGISLFKANNNTLNGNTADYNFYGFTLDSSSNNILINNTANDNDERGIYFSDESPNPDYSYNNILIGNTANNNGFVGIWFTFYSYNNILIGNTANNNDWFGIYLESNSNNLINNTINSNSKYGLFFGDAFNNTLTGNTVKDNVEYGVYLISASNLFWNNNFVNNGVNAYEDSSSSNNKWNFTNIGNYWDDFAANEGYPYKYIVSGDGLGIDYWPAAVCTDSDGGEIYDVQGVTRKRLGGKYTDQCIFIEYVGGNPNYQRYLAVEECSGERCILQEGICVDNTVTNTRHYCDQPGMMCKQGACIEVACLTDDDCGTDGWTGSDFCRGVDVWNTWRTWTCVNPGNSSAECISTTTPQLSYNCSRNDVPAIATCTNDPDNNPLTWDYYAGFTSTCNQEAHMCAIGWVDVNSTCSIANCGAECEIDTDCDDGKSSTTDTCLDDCTCQNEKYGCTDSDGGLDYYVQGIAELQTGNSNTVYDDKCLYIEYIDGDSRHRKYVEVPSCSGERCVLQEGYCVKNRVSNVAYYCSEEGKICDQGACVET